MLPTPPNVDPHVASPLHEPCTVDCASDMECGGLPPLSLWGRKAAGSGSRAAKRQQAAALHIPAGFMVPMGVQVLEKSASHNFGRHRPVAVEISWAEVGISW